MCIYIYMCVCAFFPLSLNLSLQGTVAMGALTEDVLAPNQSNDGLMSFHRWDRLVTSGNTTSRGRVFRPHSLQSFRHFLRIEVQTCLFSKKKKGATYQGRFIFPWGFHELPWKPSSRHLERCHPQNQSKRLPTNQFLPALRQVFTFSHLIWSGKISKNSAWSAGRIQLHESIGLTSTSRPSLRASPVPGGLNVWNNDAKSSISFLNSGCKEVDFANRFHNFI